MLGRIANVFRPSEQGSMVHACYLLESTDFVWALGSLCALNKVPFEAELLLKQFPPPYTTDTLIHAARALGFRVKFKKMEAASFGEVPTPCVALLTADRPATEDVEAAASPEPEADEQIHQARLSLVTEVTPERVVLFEAGTNAPVELSPEAFSARYLGQVFLVAKQRDKVSDPDSVDESQQFGFRWFVPELLKHKKVWRDVLLASLVIQLLALAACRTYRPILLRSAIIPPSPPSNAIA